jgi:hypothetical protein
MPVVINQFEIVAEPPPLRVSQEAQPGDQEAPAPAQAPTPHDIAVVVRHIRERLTRVQIY